MLHLLAYNVQYVQHHPRSEDMSAAKDLIVDAVSDRADLKVSKRLISFQCKGALHDSSHLACPVNFSKGVPSCSLLGHITAMFHVYLRGED